MSFELDNSKLLPVRTHENRTAGNYVNMSSIERWVSAIGGGGLAIYGLRRRSKFGLLLSLGGAALIHRGATGHCNTYQVLGVNTAEKNDKAEPVARDVHVEKSITIGKSPQELYGFWRQFENLPRFMRNLESVKPVGLNRWHWVAKGPLGSKVEWDAEIYNEKPNELIAWRSLEGADITNAGSVHFIPSGRGTQVKVNLNYNATGGKVSAIVAKLFGQEPGQMIEEDLRRLKQVLETGEIATIEGQSSGRNEQARRIGDARGTDMPGTVSVSGPEKTRSATAGD
jgi:uncharacterized membrane protein